MKKLKSLGDMMDASVPTTVEPAKRIRKAAAPASVEQQQLVVQLPSGTVKALKVAALEAETTVRAMLLKALHEAGYPVPAGQIVDFRKVQRG